MRTVSIAHPGMRSQAVIAAGCGVLEGKRIVVTRPEAQADTLCAGIDVRGGRAVLFPLMDIAPADDPSSLERACARLDEFDLAFFVSANAVRFALDFILVRRAWPDSVAVATVGKGSERILCEYGFNHVIVPELGFDTEAVLALPEFAPTAVRGRKVVVFRGDGGRDLLGEVLAERGATVEYVTAYARRRPAADIAPLIEQARRGELAALVLTSSEGVRNLVAMAGPEGMRRLADVPVFVPHPRVAGFAREAGFARVIETEAGDDGIFQALEAELGD